MTRWEILFGILRLPLDLAAAAAAMILAYRLREAGIDLLPNTQILGQSAQLPLFDDYMVTFVLPWSIVAISVLASLRLYVLRVTLGPWRELGRVIVAAGLWAALVMAWFFLQRELFFSRMLLLHATALLGAFLLLGRGMILLIQRWSLRYGIGVRSLVSCGASPLHSSTRMILERDPRYRYLGHITDDVGLAHAHATQALDIVVHTDPAPESRATHRIAAFCRDHHIAYAFLPPIFADVPHQLSLAAIGLLPILRHVPTPLDGWGRVWKRGFDILGSLVLISMASPFLIGLAVLILLVDGWPVLYVSRRVGQRAASLIPVLKFRTMVRDAEQKKSTLAQKNERRDGPLFKMKNDPRITRLGNVLRRLSLDELPQLFNVLLGHLSLVGPRPHLPEEVAKYASHERRVLTARPGITGLAQISGRSGLKFDDEIRLDMRYIEEWSPGMDLWILWRTIWVVLSGREAD